MADVDEFLDQFLLKHATEPYDPVQAHEYYLRNRELKGRVAGVKVQPTSSKVVAKTSTAVVVKKKAPVVPKKSHEQLKKETEARVAALQVKLEKLSKILKELVRQAKARSGVKTPVKKAVGAAASTKSGSTEKLTAAQKSAKAKLAKAAYEKEKKQNPSSQEDDLNKKIAEVTKKIQAMKAQIAEAKQKSASNSVGVRANPNR